MNTFTASNQISRRFLIFKGFFTCLLAMIAFACSPDESFDYSESSVEKGLLVSAVLWPTLDIPVCWENRDSITQEDRDLVRASIAGSWSSVIPFNFYGWGQCQVNNPGIRILSIDNRSNARLGTHIDGVKNGMNLNFTFEQFAQNCKDNPAKRRDCIRIIAVHEFGHALGIDHEQNRDDTPQFCQEVHPRTWLGGNIKVGEWDLNSVMNYCNPQWAGNGILSEGDKETIRTAYSHLVDRGNQPPLTPTRFKVEAKNQRKAQITWRAADLFHTGFEIARKKKRNNGGWREPQIIASVDHRAFEVIDEPGEGLYKYQVRAFNHTGYSSWTEWKKVDIQRGEGNPEALVVHSEDVPVVSFDGTANEDQISGLEGDDQISGLDGNDQISGLDGNDFINGNSGNDFINGNNGDDTVRGGQGDDVVRGGKGNDTIYGDRGNDQLYGDLGDDTYVYEAHHENITIHPDGDGNDTLKCVGTFSLVEFYEGDDLVMVMSSGGMIRLIGMRIVTTVDQFVDCGQLFNVNLQELLGGAEGDTLSGSSNSDRISGLDGNDQISGLDGNDFINGNSGNDFVNGNSGNDRVHGGQGDDTVRGGQGDDVVMGDRGSDQLYGDFGNDFYVYLPHHENITIHPHGDGFDQLVCYGAQRVAERREGNDLVMEMNQGGVIRIVDQFVATTVDQFLGCF